MKLWHEEKTEKDDQEIFAWYNLDNPYNVLMPPAEIYPRTKIIGMLNNITYTKSDINNLTRIAVGCSFDDLPDSVRYELDVDRIEKMNIGKAIKNIRKALNCHDLPDDFYQYICNTSKNTFNFVTKGQLWVISGNSLLLCSSTHGKSLLKNSYSNQTLHFTSCMRALCSYSWVDYVQFGCYCLIHLQNTDDGVPDLIGRVVGFPLKKRDEDQISAIAWGRPYGSINSSSLYSSVVLAASNLILGENKDVYCAYVNGSNIVQSNTNKFNSDEYYTSTIKVIVPHRAYYNDVVFDLFYKNNTLTCKAEKQSMIKIR